MSRSVAIASCSTRGDWEVSDDEVLAEAFGGLGVDAPIIAWDDAGTDWASFEAVLIRSPWDYTEKVDAFSAWFERVDGLSVLVNPAAVLRENLDKLYLERLAYLGVPVVPTRVVRPGRALQTGLAAGMPSAAEIAAASGCERVAVKPALGAGASGLLVADATDGERIAEHLHGLLERGPALVQPFYEAVATRGELSLVYLDGAFSHAVRKVPADGDIRVQVEYGGRYTREEPTSAAIAVGDAAIRHWPAGAMYARVDLLEVSADEWLLIECELVEPELFFRMVPGTAEAFAVATMARVEAARSDANRRAGARPGGAS